MMLRNGISLRQLCRDLRRFETRCTLQVGVLPTLVGAWHEKPVEKFSPVAKNLSGANASCGLKWIAIAFPSDNILSGSRTLTF